MLFLKVLKIIAIILGVLSLPLVIFGWGLLITIPLFAFAFAMDRVTNPKPDDINKDLNSKLIINIIVLLAAGASLFGIYALGAIGNIDTTGSPNGLFLIAGTVIVFILAALVLWLVNKQRASG
jgi:hypothetical protein